ncbi:hypothetical protein ACIGMX_33115 [Streptomyces aquilus]|uniref:hypothetical protein n=1 Tax=Streptomyces aquilus TaxID=2548456 RepID=UPI0037D923A8
MGRILPAEGVVVDVREDFWVRFGDAFGVLGVAVVFGVAEPVALVLALADGLGVVDPDVVPSEPVAFG